MNSSQFKCLLLNLCLLFSVSAYAEERVLEDSLVYDDPTVSKPGKWAFGGAVGAYYSNSNTSGTDTSGNVNTATQQFTQPQGSLFAGYGDFTLLARYQKINATTGFTNNTMKNSGDTYSVDLRWLITDLQVRYFVPYVLASYVNQTENYTFSNIDHGVQQTGKTVSKGPGFGLGGIIPITDKYGLRADLRQYNANPITTSNLYSGLNSNRNIQYRLAQATAYYNITDSINLQVGGQYTYIANQAQSTSYGFVMSLGYTYH
jgi:hypothetical protein